MGWIHVTVRLKAELLQRNSLNIYGSKQLEFPLPQYYVFYNGTKAEPDRQELRLTDAFPKIDGKEACLECKAILLNINYGHNAPGNGCRMDFSPMHRRCILNGLKSCCSQQLLLKCRGEVRDMVLTTFNKELYERDLKEEGRSEGKTQGKIELVQKKLRKNKSLQEIATELEEEIQNIEPIYLLVKENPEKTEEEILELMQRGRG